MDLVHTKVKGAPGLGCSLSMSMTVVALERLETSIYAAAGAVHEQTKTEVGPHNHVSALPKQFGPELRDCAAPDDAAPTSRRLHQDVSNSFHFSYEFLWREQGGLSNLRRRDHQGNQGHCHLDTRCAE